MSELPKANISEMKFQKSKKYRRLRIENYSELKYNVMVDVDESNLLTIKVFPSDIDPTRF